jgi:hypothetical protein
MLWRRRGDGLDGPLQRISCRLGCKGLLAAVVDHKLSSASQKIAASVRVSSAVLGSNSMRSSSSTEILAEACFSTSSKMEPQGAQNEYHDHDEADEVDDAVHVTSPCAVPLRFEERHGAVIKLVARRLTA